MANLKDTLKLNLSQTIEFCEDSTNLEDEKLNKATTGYLYSLSIAAMIVEKFKALPSKEAKMMFIQELKDALLNESGPGIPPIPHGGGATA